MSRPIIVVDIDGTIADTKERAAMYLNSSPKDWDSFYARCSDDKPIMPIVHIINTLANAYKIVFCSGRRESCRNDTVDWIKANMDINQPIVMLLRGNNDTRHDTHVKPELLEDYLSAFPNESVEAIFEDRNTMVAKWRELGYTCVQVADGNF